MSGNLLQRNTASQTFLVYAYNITTGAPVTGDAANIDAKIRIDGGTSNDLGDAAPVELDATNEPGYYRFDLTQAETNGADFIEVIPRSSTGSVTVLTCGGPRFTLYEPTFLDNGIIAKAAALATVDTVVDGIQADLDNGTDGLGAIKADTAAILIDTADIQPKLGTPAADLSADIAAVKSDTAATLADTADIQPKLGTITDLGGGATVGANFANLAGATFSAATDSQEAIRDAITTVDTVVDGIQADLDNGTDGLGAIKADTAATLADTNELQTDWANGGRLDNILDARASQTSVDAVQTDATAILADTDAIDTLTATALPASTPSSSGGLALFDDLKILSDYGSVNDGSASTTSCVLSSGFDNTTDDFYKNAIIVFDLSTGKGRARVTAYTASTRTITYAPALPVAPANGAYVEILGLSL